MKKDYIIVSLIFCAFILIVFFLNFDFKKGKIDTSSAYRQKNEIANDKTICLDEEAIALSGSPPSTELRSIAFSAYEQINTIRTQNGLNELKWDNNLESVASVRAKEITENFSHTRPNGSQWYTVNSKIQGGENLAYGFSTATDVVDAWMNSPTHKDNILYGDFKTMAISIYVIDDTFYWSQEFGY